MCNTIYNYLAIKSEGWIYSLLFIPNTPMKIKWNKIEQKKAKKKKPHKITRDTWITWVIIVLLRKFNGFLFGVGFECMNKTLFSNLKFMNVTRSSRRIKKTFIVIRCVPSFFMSPCYSQFYFALYLARGGSLSRCLQWMWMTHVLYLFACQI